MKALHKIAGNNDLRKGMGYIQLKDGFFNVTDAHMLLKMPAEEVIDEEVLVEIPNHCYFEARMWNLSKIEKSKSQILKNDLIICLDKQNRTIGYLPFLTEQDFFEKNLMFPDFDKVLNSLGEKELIDEISFNPYLLKTICEVVGVYTGYKMVFYGKLKGVKIKFDDSKAIGLVMPQYINEFKYK